MRISYLILILVGLLSCKKDLTIIPDENYDIIVKGEPWGELPDIVFTGFTIYKIYDDQFAASDPPDIYVNILEQDASDPWVIISNTILQSENTYNNIIFNAKDQNAPYSVDFDTPFIVKNDTIASNYRIYFETYEYDGGQVYSPFERMESFVLSFSLLKYAYLNNLTSLYLRDSGIDVELHFYFQ